MRKLYFLVLLSVVCLGYGFAMAQGFFGLGNKEIEVWQDPATKLTWEAVPMKELQESSLNWQEAKDHCENLTLGGFDDWRLPTISELRSLIRGCPSTVKDGPCQVTDSCLKESCQNAACGTFLSKPKWGCPEGKGPVTHKTQRAYWPAELSGYIRSYWSSSVREGKSGYTYVSSQFR
jgi:hypothetical protein